MTAHVSSTGKQNNKIRLKNDKVNLSEDSTATFEELKFLEGSSQNLLRVRFTLDVELSIINDNEIKQTTSVTLTSDPSEPLVIMVHQSQWQESEKMLLVYEALSRGPDQHKRLLVNRTRLFNALQSRIQMIFRSSVRHPSSRNCVEHPVPPLFRREMQFMINRWCHKKVEFGEDDIFELWNWVGSALYIVKDHRRNLLLWRDGVIAGFLEHSDTERLLSEHPQGTAIIRFSPDVQGRFCISFVRSENRDIGHYLLKHEESKRKVSDFIAPFQCISSVLVAIKQGRSLQDLVFQRVGKEDILKTYNPKHKRSIVRHNPNTFSAYNVHNLW